MRIQIKPKMLSRSDLHALRNEFAQSDFRYPVALETFKHVGKRQLYLFELFAIGFEIALKGSSRRIEIKEAKQMSIGN